MSALGMHYCPVHPSSAPSMHFANFHFLANLTDLISEQSGRTT